MAEGFLRALGGDGWEAYSAGLDPQGVNPGAVRVMSEAGIDISGQASKPIDPAVLDAVDLVVTLCGSADERCPVLPAHVRREHWPLEDPAKATGSPDEVLAVFRRVRDEIRHRVERLIGQN
jgi:arsenate reductase